MSECFGLVEMSFRRGPVAIFSFGDDTAGHSLEIRVTLDPGVELEEAIAIAAESAAAHFDTWAQKAKDYTTAARTGALRKPSATP